MNLTAAQLRTIREAADFCNCLDCGAAIDFAKAIDGQALCDPCHVEAVAEDAALEADTRHAALARRVLAECVEGDALYSHRHRTPAPIIAARPSVQLALFA